ncbi:MAG: hypothetical protein V4501_03240 [Pseudomonadota bacterium]
MAHPRNKLTIIGAGIIGALEAYYAYLSAKKAGEQIRVTILEKHATVLESTSSNIVPSLTPDEILSVVPRGKQLVEKLKLLFSEPGGIRVDDVPGVNDSAIADEFKEQVQLYSEDEAAHNLRTQALLDMGKRSMDFWQELFDNADDELKLILTESNFNPCREPRNSETQLRDGYRIDLIYNVPNAKSKALSMQADYEKLGYTNCKILSPDEVQKLDPILAKFCASHAERNEAGELQWHNDAVALWRPGGCLDSNVFLPKFFEYLENKMGKYQHADGSVRDCFQIKYERQVQEVILDDSNNRLRVTGLKFFGNTVITSDKNNYLRKDYVFCPGEAVGTLRSLDFDEPAYAGFAGAVLKLVIPVPADKIPEYNTFNHCMEVHQEGVVLAWQARFHNNNIIIGVGGTKAFYADKLPSAEHDFARNRNLLQLNMINNVLPDYMSLALGRDTHGQQLTEHDLAELQAKGIATRWVGTRAVAYDGFPTLGRLFKAGRAVENGRNTTHLGSGGVSFAPAAVLASRAADEAKSDELTQNVLQYSNPSRRM